MEKRQARIVNTKKDPLKTTRSKEEFMSRVELKRRLNCNDEKINQYILSGDLAGYDVDYHPLFNPLIRRAVKTRYDFIFERALSRDHNAEQYIKAKEVALDIIRKDCPQDCYDYDEDLRARELDRAVYFIRSGPNGVYEVERKYGLSTKVLCDEDIEYLDRPRPALSSNRTNLAGPTDDHLITPESRHSKIIPTANSIFREDKEHWRIVYKGEIYLVGNPKYIRYLVLILNYGKRGISSAEIIREVNRDDLMLEKEIPEDLSIGSKLIKEREISYRDIEKINKLMHDIETEDDPLIREEMKVEHAKMMTRVNQMYDHNIKTPPRLDRPLDKKSQAAVRKGLKSAYKAFRKKGLKDLARDLERDIQTDKNYGWTYNSPDMTWDIQQ